MAPPQSSENEPSSRSSNNPANHSAVALEFHFLTLFPEIFQPVLQSSLAGKAAASGLISFELTQIRDFAKDKHRTVDETPYGGGEGMLLKADVLHAAWSSARERAPRTKTLTLLMSPQGERFDQEMAKELATYEKLIFVCGHYEGVDERFIELCVDREISIGDYVLTGGELPAMVIADAVSRWIPGVVGKENSVTQDTFGNGLLKYPQYTRPREFQGLSVPEVLLSGDHGAIAKWRFAQMEERTRRKRPDLWEKHRAKNKL